MNTVVGRSGRIETVAGTATTPGSLEENVTGKLPLGEPPIDSVSFAYAPAARLVCTGSTTIGWSVIVTVARRFAIGRRDGGISTSNVRVPGVAFAFNGISRKRRFVFASKGTSDNVVPT